MIVVGMVENAQGIERKIVFFQRFSNLKPDLPLFSGLFLYILHQNDLWVGGGLFLHHKSIVSLNIAYSIAIMDLLLCSTHLVS